MALEEYKRKRDFKKTSEPGPGKIVKRDIKNKSGGLSFLIQKHDATRLHYDFRLELDGVLLSWAVTRGPSLSIADKRLAVRTEDHPIAYGTFEGTIPQGQYGGGTVMLWDNGTWEPKGDVYVGLKKGHISFTLHGQRLHGDWDLIRMHGQEKRENWLLIKEDDEHAAEGKKAETFLDDNAFSITTGRKMEDIASGRGGSKVWQSKGASAANPVAAKTQKVEKTKPAKKTTGGADALMKSYPEVMLATLVDKPPEGEAWLHEIKFDGYRLLGFIADGEARLRTRNGNDWTDKFPTLAEGLQKLKADNAVLDMEAVVVNAQGKTSFEGLKAALGDPGDPLKIIAYAFDILHLDGQDLRRLPLTERKTALERLLKRSKDQKTLLYSEHITGHGGEMISQSCSLGLEGIISKEAQSAYSTGRQKSWLKSKCALRQEFIILGYSDARKGERAMGALYLGYQKAGKLHYGGKVGTGFTMKAAREIIDRLDRMKRDEPILPSAEMDTVAKYEWRQIHWVEPKQLCEVAFTEWTEGGHVRHPSFQGLRDDKDARDVRMEKPLPADKTAKEAERSILKQSAVKKGKTEEAVPERSAKHAADEKETGDLVLHGVTITHPDRVVSQEGHVTKGELARYYAGIAPKMLPLLVRRPLTVLRCPGGIGPSCFYQRNPGQGLGKSIKPFHFKHNGKKYEYFYIENARGLMELVQMGAIEIHPWGATVDAIDYPDRMIFDLDPDPTVPFEAVKLAAEDLRVRLKKKKYNATLKTTGGKGLHVVIQLDGTMKWPEAKEFAASIAHEMVEDAPDAYVATMTKAKRTGKIFIDYFRNDYTATAVGDYTVRARAGAPVAMPIKWSELKNLRAGNQFNVKDLLESGKIK